MLLSILSAASLAVSPPPSGEISGEFIGHVRRDAAQTFWERYDVRLSNAGTGAKTLAFCPADARLLVSETPFLGVQEVHHSRFFAPGGALHSQAAEPGFIPGFASALDGESWSFDCEDIAIAPGESVKVSFYFRWLSPRRDGSAFLVDTSLGRLVVAGGKVTVVQGGAEAA